jgi:hypothetical protein
MENMAIATKLLKRTVTAKGVMGSRKPKRVSLSQVHAPRPAETAPLLELMRVVSVDKGRIAVALPGCEPIAAQSVVAYADLAADDQVVVARAGNGSDLVILGRIVDPLAPSRDVRVNGRKVSIEADSELILRCASATIRIGSNGLVAVRGDRVTTQARGANRIRGGSVEIN